MSELFYEAGPPAPSGGRKFMLATTSYDRPDAQHGHAMQESRVTLNEAGIAAERLLLVGNCHVDDARNSVVATFLESDCTDLVFVDADVVWSPDVLVKLCSIEDGDIIGGIYPYRRDQLDEGEAMPVRMKDIAEVEGDLLEVEGLPTGFMRIKRSVLQTLADHSTWFIQSKNPLRIPLLFERTLVGEENGRMGGDINFCRKARDHGFKVYAVPELRLGHAARVVIHDSLAASLRRRLGQTMRHLANKIRAGAEEPADYDEAFAYYDNKWAAPASVLAQAVIMARAARGPIIEAGSGLTTILMAAANPDQTVFALEHDPVWAGRLRQLVAESGVKNVALCLQPMKDNWYDLSDIEDVLPARFAVGVCDGPPRRFRSRTRFMEVFGDRCTMMLFDDADEPGYALKIREWAQQNNRSVEHHSPRSAIVGRKAA